jgi:hypothetical protein
MAKRPRIGYPGARNHLMHRGARRAPIFFDAFTEPLKTWGEALIACLYDK